MVKRGMKKGLLVEGHIIKLILLIFSFLLIFAFIYRFYTNMTENADETACRDSMLLTEVLARRVEVAGANVGKYVKPFPAQCKTEDKMITTRDPDKAKKEFAELMAWCWWMMGEGNIKPFNKDWFIGGRKCFVCYTVRFPYIDVPISQEDFMFYLRENGREGVTYYDHLDYGGEKLIGTPLSDPIDNQRVYAIVYSSPQDPQFGLVLTCLAGATKVGLMASAATPVTGVIVGGSVFVACGVGAIGGQIIESFKEDVVYAVDVNRGKSGCYGNFFAYVEDVKSS